MADFPMIEAEGLTKRYGPTQALAGIDLRSRPGRSWACSARTAPARRRRSAFSPPLPSRTPVGHAVAGHDVVSEAAASADGSASRPRTPPWTRR